MRTINTKYTIRPTSAAIVSIFVFVYSMCQFPTAFAQTPNSMLDDKPDLQIIVIGGMPAGDLVNLTYPGVPTPLILKRDVSALGTALATDTSQAKITNSALPDSTGSTPVMTSVTLTVQGAAPLTSGTLPVEHIISALRPYRIIDISYIMPPTYRYTGLHNYKDGNVFISVSQSGSTYLFKVKILNSNFATLSLPSSDASAAQASASALDQNRRGLVWERLAGCLIIGVLAALIGWVVFRALTKLQKTEA